MDGINDFRRNWALSKLCSVFLFIKKQTRMFTKTFWFAFIYNEFQIIQIHDRIL